MNKQELIDAIAASTGESKSSTGEAIDAIGGDEKVAIWQHSKIGDICLKAHLNAQLNATLT